MCAVRSAFNPVAAGYYSRRSCYPVDMKDLSPELVSRLVAEGVDLDRMLRFLDDLNAGKYDSPVDSGPYSVPDFPHPAIFDRRGTASLSVGAEFAAGRLVDLGVPVSAESLGARVQGDGTLLFDEAALEKIGMYLYPVAAYGVLNGGSASSYADIKKNSALDSALFGQYRARFDALAELCRGQPKGITPAFLHPDGTPGFSFLFLKLRMLLEHKRRYLELTGSMPELILPAFQMTSVLTDASIMEAFRAYSVDPGLKSLADSLGCTSIEIFTEMQTMMAAITHSSEGFPRRIFDRAWGKADSGIAMPGGHGQNFEVLGPIYRKMRDQGIRFAWLGNIDNMGYTVDPVSLAIFALSGKDAAFEESWRTPIDVKGGILVSRPDGRLTAADIGPAISTEAMLAFEAEGRPVLFNCGIGLFDLDRLIARLDEIPYKLPLRITDQDKDAGRYAQAEQITWEIIGLLDDPMFFAVEKSKRFLAAKMLMETILTSVPPDSPPATAGSTGRPCVDSAGAESAPPAAETDAAAESDAIALVARESHAGLVRLLETEYGLKLSGGRWLPVEAAVLKS